MKIKTLTITAYSMLLFVIILILFQMQFIRLLLPNSALGALKKMDSAQLTFFFYAVMGIIGIILISILILSSKNYFDQLGLTFPWKRFKIGWFIVICFLWILPNALNLEWAFPSISPLSIIAVLMAPVVEELIFRGFIQGLLPDLSLWKWAKLNLGVVVMSLFFALYHFDILHPGSITILPFLLHFAGGITLGTLRNQTGSIWLGVVVHSAGNLTAALHPN
jgi:membrane protease YdiL (CAAX protease family)